MKSIGELSSHCVVWVVAQHYSSVVFQGPLIDAPPAEYLTDPLLIGPMDHTVIVVVWLPYHRFFVKAFLLPNEFTQLLYNALILSV